MASKSFYALVAGVGPGTGRATALRFAQKYPVVLLARRPESYEEAVADIKKAGGQAIGITADVSDPTNLKNALASIDKELPGSRLAAAVFNVNISMGASFFHFAQATLPLLQKSVPDSEYPPTLIITGATASVKGSAQFGSFAAGKWALRGLGQSLAREFHPQGIHVAHAVIDGVIDIPRTKDWQVNNGAEDGKIKPEIAETYWFLHTQHRSAFTHEVDIRPYVEKF
ncbi:hypothetical protein LRP88_13098 [Fusarium phalaenopsidis]